MDIFQGIKMTNRKNYTQNNCLISLIINGIEISTTMSYHLRAIRMTIIQKTRVNTC